MTTTKTLENDRKGEQSARRTPPIVSPEAWEAARQQMLVKEKALTRARDALAAERRRVPWMAVEKAYEFEGPRRHPLQTSNAASFAFPCPCFVRAPAVWRYWL
jgi:hypothetical protein